MEACVFKNFFLRWDFTFPVIRGIKWPISAGDWHVLVAGFSKKSGIYKKQKVWKVHVHLSLKKGKFDYFIAKQYKKVE